ncbi:MAG: leucine-rich repeat domain-containing protein, partial [Eubacterium sp.]|nr:leucine-rich repeat domain-containing protein [Eubacterium sp.]
MKRIFKTLTVFIVAIVFCVNSAAVVSAEGETSGDCGDGVTWSFDADTSTLTIEGSGAIDDYTRDSEPWYSLKSNIKTVVINSGVTRIGNNAFYNCALTSVSVPDTVTSIGQDAFFDSSLQSIDIPSSVKTLEYGAFRDSELQSVTFNEGLESIGAAAFYASKVSSMSAIPKSVKSIGVNAFVAMGSASTGRIDSVYLLSTDCALPTESGSYNDIFYNSFKQPTVYFVYSEATEEYLNRVEHTNYVILCLDGTENHTYEKTSTTATCTEAGKATMTCSVCGATKEEDEDALGHSYTNYVSDGNATCTADGTKTAECDNGCGEKDTVSDENSALGHSFTNYISDGNATCTADGTKTAQCDNGCGEKDTVTDEGSMTEHTYEETVIAPACTEQGY